MTTMYVFAVFSYEVYSFSKEYDVYEILFKMEFLFLHFHKKLRIPAYCLQSSPSYVQANDYNLFAELMTFLIYIHIATMVQFCFFKCFLMNVIQQTPAFLKTYYSEDFISIQHS